MQVKSPQKQEIHFKNGSRQTIHDVVYAEQGSWWHLFTKDGRCYIINPDHIVFIRVYGELTGPAKEAVERFNNETR